MLPNVKIKFLTALDTSSLHTLLVATPSFNACSLLPLRMPLPCLFFAFTWLLFRATEKLYAANYYNRLIYLYFRLFSARHFCCQKMAYTMARRTLF